MGSQVYQLGFWRNIEMNAGFSSAILFLNYSFLQYNKCLDWFMVWQHSMWTRHPIFHVVLRHQLKNTLVTYRIGQFQCVALEHCPEHQRSIRKQVSLLTKMKNKVLARRWPMVTVRKFWTEPGVFDRYCQAEIDLLHVDLWVLKSIKKTPLL